MNKYRTHKCNELRKEDVDKKISLSGWINKKRDHGNLLFIDLRDSTSLLQCVVDNSSPIFENLSKIKNEDVIKITGEITERTPETVNSNLESGEVELQINSFEHLSHCTNSLPLEAVSYTHLTLPTNPRV